MTKKISKGAPFHPVYVAWYPQIRNIHEDLIKESEEEFSIWLQKKETRHR